MKAYKCDRCGSLYENYSHKRIWITDIFHATAGIKDLCSECQKKLEKWFFQESEVEDDRNTKSAGDN